MGPRVPCYLANDLPLMFAARASFLAILICISTVFSMPIKPQPLEPFDFDYESEGPKGKERPKSVGVFAPKNEKELTRAIAECVQWDDYCRDGPKGPITSWDVSSMTNMKQMFASHFVFSGDLSGWDVSGVTNMHAMFFLASAFNGDISSWDVSHVTDMGAMFSYANNFNQDISNWNVSSVTDMERMFYGASSFAQTLGGAWVQCKASKDGMFASSHGRIAFKPSSTEELGNALGECHVYS